MKLLRPLLALAFAAALSACQTISGGPPAGAQSVLEQQGFKQESPDVFNKDLTPGDIRTTAFYVCELPSCGGLALVMYGTDPDAQAMLKEINDLEGKTKKQGLRTTNRLLRTAGIKDMNLVNYAVFSAPDGGRGLTADAVGKLGGETIFLKLTVIYRNNIGRMVAAASNRRGVTARFGGRGMLE
jgi:hypothetical protein